MRGRLSEAFLSAYPELRNKRLLLFLGRIHEKKGCDLLVEAFARVAADGAGGPPGDGRPRRRSARRGSCKPRAQSLGIAARISWPGMLSGDLKWGAFHACEVFCLPSHQENFGIAVVEAMACSRPVLISDKVNIWREIAEDQRRLRRVRHARRHHGPAAALAGRHAGRAGCHARRRAALLRAALPAWSRWRRRWWTSSAHTPRTPPSACLMKLLVYGINFAPELTGIGKYTGEMVAWLAAHGHEVRVVTAPPYYPDWKVRPGYHAGRYTRHEWQGAQVLRTPLWVPRKVTGMKRLLHLASFAASSVPALLAQWHWKPDVVWVTEPPLFCTPAALAFARLRSAKAWLHIQDYEVDAAFDLGLLKGARTACLRCGGRALADAPLRPHLDHLAAHDRTRAQQGHRGRAAGLAAQLGRRLGDPAAAGASPYRAELGIRPDAVVALYSGNMGAKQGLELLAEMALMLKDQPGLEFVFCGNGAGRAELVKRCESMTNVRFLDLQPVERLGDFLGLADIHLLPQRADAADLVMPSKLTGMLSSGRPVVAGARPETELGKVTAECGIAVAPDDAKAFAQAVLSLATQPERRARAGPEGPRGGRGTLRSRCRAGPVRARSAGLRGPALSLARSRNKKPGRARLLLLHCSSGRMLS